MRPLSIVRGEAKYTVVTSGCRGDILKKGPRSVRFSIPGADCAIWKVGCCASAFSSGGNREYVRRACEVRLSVSGQASVAYIDVGFVIVIHAHGRELRADVHHSFGK